MASKWASRAKWRRNGRVCLCRLCSADERTRKAYASRDRARAGADRAEVDDA